MGKRDWVCSFDDDSHSFFGSGGWRFQNWTDEEKKLHDRWYQMMERCYNPKAKAYKDYGACGIGVEPFLRKASNYYTFVRSLPGYRQDMTGFDVDKDIASGHGSDYSRQSLTIVTKGQNTAERNSRVVRDLLGVPCYAIYKPTGEIVEAVGTHELARKCYEKFGEGEPSSSFIVQVLHGYTSHGKRVPPGTQPSSRSIWKNFEFYEK